MLLNRKVGVALVVLFIPTVISSVEAKVADESIAMQDIVQRLERLIANTDILKLRLELNAEKEQQHRSDVERKYRHLEEMINSIVEQQNKDSNVLIQLSNLVESQAHALARLLTRDEGAILISEFRQLSAQQEVILKKLDVQHNDDAKKVDSAKQCVDTIATVFDDLKSTLITLDVKLTNHTGHLQKLVVNHKKSEITTHNILEKLHKRENNQICERTGNNTMSCYSPYVRYPTSCADNNTTHCSAGQCLITNSLIGTGPFNVTCDDVSGGGGWLVIQRRINGSIDFYRNWTEYKNGFGDLNGEFWLGLDKLHALTTTLEPVELLIQLTDHENVTKYAQYKEFVVGSEDELYKLKELGDYEGNAGDSLRQHKGFNFTTMDKDNDNLAEGNCAVWRKGAWWYNSCYFSNLNGFYYGTGKPKYMDGMRWGTFHDSLYSLKSAKMMIRPLRGISN